MIEKNIFQSWSQTIDEIHPALRQKIDGYKTMNPEYTYFLYSDQDMDRFVDEHYPGEIADCYHRLNIIVAKVDFWRYLVLYKYGGVYLDMDSEIKCPLHSFICDEDSAIITAEGNPNMFVQWALIFAKGHPILKKTIELIVDNIKNNRYPNDIHKMTGPTVYSRAIFEIHMGLFRVFLKHSDIKRGTDITYSMGDISYRVYGLDYNGAFTFEHDAKPFMYIGKKQWRQEQQEKSLLK